MSSPTSEPPLHLELRPSSRLASAVLLVHGGALAILIPLALPPATLVALAAALLGSLTWLFPIHVSMRSAHAIRRLVWEPDGVWRLWTTNGNELTGNLLHTSYSHPQWVILNFQIEGQRRSRAVVILPDSLDRDTLRRLRARLRHARPTDHDTAP